MNARIARRSLLLAVQLGANGGRARTAAVVFVPIVVRRAGAAPLST